MGVRENVEKRVWVERGVGGRCGEGSGGKEVVVDTGPEFEEKGGEKERGCERKYGCG